MMQISPAEVMFDSEKWAGVDLKVLWPDSASWDRASHTDLNSNNSV